VEVTVLDASGQWLDGRQRNDTSQFGEDGLIEAVFARIGHTTRWCFEVGAANGLFFSNTKRLRDLGWHAILIEGDGRLCEECRQFENDRVKVIHERIDSGSLDAILARCGSQRPDLGVIDIDGQDYWVWKALVAQPRVMLVEYGYWNKTGKVPPEGSPEAEHQAGLDTICGLGIQKGYVPLASTYCNVLFVDKDVWESN
jgi:hypothetical protein